MNKLAIVRQRITACTLQANIFVLQYSTPLGRNGVYGRNMS